MGAALLALRGGQQKAHPGLIWVGFLLSVKARVDGKLFRLYKKTSPADEDGSGTFENMDAIGEPEPIGTTAHPARVLTEEAGDLSRRLAQRSPQPKAPTLRSL